VHAQRLCIQRANQLAAQLPPIARNFGLHAPQTVLYSQTLPLEIRHGALALALDLTPGRQQRFKWKSKSSHDQRRAIGNREVNLCASG
jgi:hypothetical protein